MAIFRCPFDKQHTFTDIKGLEDHLVDVHGESLDGMSGAHYLFSIKTGKTKGKCIVTGEPTTFNEVTKKYNRVADNDVAREKYAKMFKERMMKVYGKETLLDDPEHQKRMLGNREISGEYTWNDGTKYTYTGSYELDFMKYLNVFLELPSNDVVAPAAEVITYEFEGKKHFYIPDFQILSLDLLIEIKGTNGHYQKRDNAQELAKDEAAKKSPFHFIKIMDQKYDQFYDGLVKRVWTLPKKH